MTIDNFNELNKDIIRQCFKLLNDKGHDYTEAGTDALANFKLVSSRVGLSPLQVWSVYFTKHIDSLDTYIKKGELKSETIDSRIQDSINYLLLLNALVKEKENNIEKQS